MKTIMEIYKDVQDEQKDLGNFERTKALKMQLMKNIEKDTSKNEPVQYDRDKFLCYKVESNSYDINHVVIILTVVPIILSIGSMMISITEGKETIYWIVYFLSLILACVCPYLILKMNLLGKAGNAKVISVILDEIDREIWQGKDN